MLNDLFYKYLVLFKLLYKKSFKPEFLDITNQEFFK